MYHKLHQTEGKTRPLPRQIDRLLPGCTTYMSASPTDCLKAGDMLTLYGTSSPQGMYKDFKEALNIRLNGNQHPGPQIDKMAACFQRMTAASVPIPPQLQGMILLAAMPSKWEMLI